MTKPRAAGGTDNSLGALVAEYRQTLTALQQITEELASRIRGLEVIVPTLATDFISGELEERQIPGAHPNLRIQTLGAFQILADGEPLEIPASGQPATILKLLADRGTRSTPRETLIEALWPDSAPDVGANRLRVAIHGLRQLMGAERDLILFDGGSYHLNSEHMEIDADRFEELIGRGAAWEELGDADGAMAAYREAASLYRGDYFEEDLFDDWSVLRRQHLRDLYLNLLVKLASLAFARDDDSACIRRCHEIIRQDDCSEDAYRLLMLMHARRGNRARALRWYELCEQTLERELGVSPSLMTQQIRDQIFADKPTQ